MRSETLIAVVVVTHNSESTISRCLKELRKESSPYHITVVDNASIDQTCDVVVTEGLADRLIKNQDNRGYGVAVNQALRELSCNNEASAVVLLDPDCFVTPATLEKLNWYLEFDPNIGAVSPVLVNTSGERQVTAHQFRTYRTELRRIFHEQPSGVLRTSTHKSVRLTDWVVGSCLMIRRTALSDVEGAAEQYFVYVEDIDICYRLALKGWQVVIDTETVAMHIGGHSLSSTGFARFAPIVKLINELLFYETFYSRLKCSTIALLRLLRVIRAKGLFSQRAAVLALASIGVPSRAIGTAILARQPESVRKVLKEKWPAPL
ncbi:glycosyltransferase [Mangrovactinospora gilvigrisea]|uniref:glycosyltransferase n=1 Tax=Mangrovactinospora gilvigrisea TaxID=1428644 RepID=UPI003AF339D2